MKRSVLAPVTHKKVPFLQQGPLNQGSLFFMIALTCLTLPDLNNNYMPISQLIQKCAKRWSVGEAKTGLGENGLVV